MPSPSKPELIYAAGLDNDLVCGEWHSKRKKTVHGFGQSLHVNAPWCGLDVYYNSNKNEEIIAGK